MGLRAISWRYRDRLDSCEPARRPVAAGPAACPQGTPAAAAGEPSSGDFGVVLRSLSPAGRRSDEAHVSRWGSGGSPRLSGARILHGDMKKVAQQFSEGGVSPKLSPGMNGQAVQPELIGVAATFVDLQQARREADYDTTRRDDSRGGMSSTWWTVRSRHSAIGPRYEGAFRRMRFSRDCSRSATCASEERSNPTTPGGRKGG